MDLLEPQVDTGSSEFRANAEHNRALAEELREKLTRVAQGGVPKLRQKHEERGKLFVRERIERLLDPGTPFLETSLLAAGVLVTVTEQQLTRQGKSLSGEEAEAIRKPILEKYENEGNPYYATARLWDDGVIDPAETCHVLALALSANLNARIEDSRFGVFRM
jgi:acetyl-CoA carboxylase carboxyltransferase component